MTLQEEMNEKAHDSQKNILIVKQESFEKHTILKYTCTKIFLFTNLDTKKNVWLYSYKDTNHEPKSSQCEFGIVCFYFVLFL